MDFTRFSKSHILFEIHFCDQAPRSLRFLQKYPWFALMPSGRIGTPQCSPRAPAGGGAAKFRRTGGRDRPGAGGGRPERSLGPISTGAWSGGAAAATGASRCASCFGEVADGASEQAAREAVPGSGRAGLGAVSRQERAQEGARRGRAEGDGRSGSGLAVERTTRARWPASPFIGGRPLW
jgi:hypothetical protein